jgi:hypothetical protein
MQGMPGRPNKIKPQLVELLQLLGFGDAEESPLLDFVLQSETQAILDATNQDAVPRGLYDVCAWRAAGRFLSLKLSAGQLTAEQLEALHPELLESAVKQLKEGEVTTYFAVSDAKAPQEAVIDRLRALAELLLDYGSGRFARYRRLQW